MKKGLIFIFLLQPGNSTKFDRMETTDGRQLLICAENKKVQAVAAVPEGTIIGPVLEVHIVKILDEYGMEVAIPPMTNPTYTFYFAVSLETERFLNEIHDHKEEFRSSNKLLTELQGSVKSEPCEERRGSSSNKEPCANSFSNPPPRASMEGHSCAFTRWRIFSNCCIQDGYTNAASL